MSRTVKIHHALHGYDGGHRLLVASTELDRSARPLLDTLSDAAGPELRHDYDGYLTGYPLPAGRYALGCTWYAPEMPRPNCVWTHTLIVDAGALDSPAALSLLGEHFRRPSGPADLDFYRQPSTVDVEDPGAFWPSRFSPPPWTADLVGRLYSGRPAYATTERHRDAVDLVMALSGQQWPRLRAHFSFCTAAQGPRRVGDRPFDLELVVPGRGAWGRKPAERTPVPDWARLLVDDMRAENSSLRDFLVRACADDTTPVAMGLAACWYADGDFVGFLTSQAARPNGARGAKRAIFRPGGLLARRSPDAAMRILHLVRQAQTAQSLDLDDIDLRQWADQARTVHPQETLRFWMEWTASAGVRTEAFDIVTAAVLGGVRPDDLTGILDREPAVIGMLLTEKEDPVWCRAWLALPDGQFRRTLPGALETAPRWRPGVLTTLVDLTRDQPEHAGQVIDQLLNSRTEAVAATTVRILSRASRAGIDPLRERVRIRQDAVEFLLGQSPTAEELALLAELSPVHAIVTASTCESWLPTLPYLWRYTHAPTTLLAVALRDDSTAANELLGRLYAHLWQRVALNDESAWNYCRETVLPGLRKSPQRDSLCTELGQRLAARPERAWRQIIAEAAATDRTAAESLWKAQPRDHR